MREGIVTGQVLKTRGLRGEVKIRMADARKNRFTAVSYTHLTLTTTF